MDKAKPCLNNRVLLSDFRATATQGLPIRLGLCTAGRLYSTGKISTNFFFFVLFSFIDNPCHNYSISVLFDLLVGCWENGNEIKICILNL